MCNIREYIDELNQKLARVSKERDEAVKKYNELKERYDNIVECQECQHFSPKDWDCELFPGAHTPTGFCDLGEKP